MSLTDFLNADVDQIGARVAGAWAWWTEQLSEVFGAANRRGGPASSLPVAELGGQDLWALRTRSGVRLLRPGEVVRFPVAVRLDPDLVLRTPTRTPRLSARDTERMLRNELDRLTPFPADSAYHLIRRLPEEAGAPTRTAEVISVPKDAADHALERATAAQLKVAAVVAEGDGPDDLVDMLPVMRPGRRVPGRGRVRLWWGLALALTAANIGVAVWHDVRITEEVEARAAMERRAAHRLTQMQQTTDALARVVSARLAVAQGREPLAALDALARALPPGARLRLCAWDGRSLHVAGIQLPGTDTARALREQPAFSQVVALTPDGVGSAETFDLKATFSPLRSRAIR